MELQTIYRLSVDPDSQITKKMLKPDLVPVCYCNYIIWTENLKLAPSKHSFVA